MAVHERSRWARIGVLIAPEDRHGIQYAEALERTGLAYETLDDRAFHGLESHGILILCGDHSLKSSQIEAISRWVEAGGILICSGTTWGLESILGLDPTSRTAGTETLVQAGPGDLWPDGAEPIRFMGGALHRALGCEVLGTVREEFVGIGRRRVGYGRAYWLAPHIGRTMTMMLLGRSVEGDAVGPSDDSALTLDDDLRAEDGTNLSFEHDRGRVGAHDPPFFRHPYVDYLRELLTRTVFEAARVTNRALAMLWYWPRFAPATAMVTFECTQYEPDHVYGMDRMLQMLPCRATWLSGPPGYGNDLYRWMKNRGHEPGLLFVTEDANGWHEGKLKIQYQVIGRSSSTSEMVAVRPMNGRWYRLTEFYAMAEEAGAKVSLSKGGRQPGTSGYLFGTCHPFHPRRPNGTSYRVLEIPYQICRPGRDTPDEAAAVLVQETLMRHGCLQIASVPEAAADPVASSSLRKVLAQCKMNRMEFVTPSELAEYERLRRSVRMAQIDKEGRGVLRVSSPTAFEKACILVSEPATEVVKFGVPSHLGVREYLGTRFLSVQIDLDAKSPNEIEVGFGGAEAAAA